MKSVIRIALDFTKFPASTPLNLSTDNLLPFSVHSSSIYPYLLYFSPIFFRIMIFDDHNVHFMSTCHYLTRVYLCISIIFASLFYNGLIEFGYSVHYCTTLFAVYVIVFSRFSLCKLYIHLLCWFALAVTLLCSYSSQPILYWIT